MLSHQRVVNLSAAHPVVLFVNDIISDDKSSTQIRIKVKYCSCSNTFRLHTFSHLQAVPTTYIKSYHIKLAALYRVIRKDCRGFSNLSYTIHLRFLVISFYGVTSRIRSSHKYPGTEGTNHNRHWNHHHWHATNSLERTRLSCWCL